MDRALKGEVMAEELDKSDLVMAAEAEWNKGRKCEAPPAAAVVVEDEEDDPRQKVTSKGLYPEKFDTPIGEEVMRPLLDGGQGKHAVSSQNNELNHDHGVALEDSPVSVTGRDGHRPRQRRRKRQRDSVKQARNQLSQQSVMGSDEGTRAGQE